MDRKEFFGKVLFGGSVLFLAPSVFSSCSKSNTPGTTGNSVIDLNASEFAALKTVGGYAYSGDVFIIRTSDTNYTALSRTCTHQGSTVSYNSTSKRLICPNHGAIFSTTGAVLQGPASRPLTIYTTTVVGTTLTIS
jgi:cytochrome b6-f complex iron-sulfur subunit